jgi:hypothetical protein
VLHGSDTVGLKSGNGSWNGIVSLVHSGMADIGIEPLTVTEERSEVVTFVDAIEVTK